MRVHYRFSVFNLQAKHLNSYQEESDAEPAV